MDSLFFALPLPGHIRSRLASFCYGLPRVHWIEEENFHLSLRHLGPVSNSNLLEIEERFKLFFFSPISLILQGVGHFHSKGNRGVIWMGALENPQISSLKKEIDGHLKGLTLPAEKHHFQPHITLGYYEHLNPQKLGDYLSTLTDYRSEIIEINSCLLMRKQQTPKRVFYQTIEHYSASLPATGED
jgi:2'-5' RNA ligase